MREKIIDFTISMLRYTVLIMAITHIFFFLYNSFKLCSFGNIQVDFGEGIMLGNAKRLLELKTIYPSLTDDVTLGVYPPLYQLLSAAVLMVTGVSLTSGRVVSTISSILIALIIYKLSRDAEGRLIQLGLSALYLSSPITMTWGPLMRVDMLAVLLTAIGLYVFLKYRGRFKYVIVAIAFASSTLTKQNMIAGITSVIIFLLMKKLWRDALKLIAYYLLIFGSCSIILILLTGGQYLNHVYLYHVGHPLEWDRLTIYHWFSYLHLPLIIMAFSSVILILRKKPSPLVFYVMLAAAMSLLIVKVGAATNYFVELVTGLALLVAAALSELQMKREKMIALIITAFFVAQFILYSQSVGIIPDIQENRYFAEQVNLLEYLKNVQGKILCESGAVAVISGKGPAIDWFLLSQVFRSGLWNEDEFIKLIDKKGFRFLVMSFNLTASDLSKMRSERFTPQLLIKLRDHFVFREKIGTYYIYERTNDAVDNALSRMAMIVPKRCYSSSNHHIMLSEKVCAMEMLMRGVHRENMKLYWKSRYKDCKRY